VHKHGYILRFAPIMGIRSKLRLSSFFGMRSTVASTVTLRIVFRSAASPACVAKEFHFEGEGADERELQRAR